MVQLFCLPGWRSWRGQLGREESMGRRFDLHMPVKRLKAQEWTGADKTIPAQALTADNAFKEEGPVAFLNLAEGAHRSERVSDQLAVNGNQAGRAGELHEFVKRRA